MEIKSNIHTHTLWSDGKDSLEAVIASAVRKGFHTIGFSEHSYVPFEVEWCMREGTEHAYVEAVALQKEIYAGQIDILTGFEYDYMGELPEEDYDYLIGSLHMLKIRGEDYAIDHSEKYFRFLLDACKGDSLEASKRYYDCLVEHTLRVKPDILGHFDLITKFSLIDCTDAYWRCAEEALRAVIPVVKAVEVNTGAMARGLRSDPYPADPLLVTVRECGCPVILSSDSHAAEKIDFAFPETLERLRGLGFTSVVEMTKSGFVEVPIS